MLSGGGSVASTVDVPPLGAGTVMGMEPTGWLLLSTRSYGSISNVPTWPPGAARSTVPVSEKPEAPDTSAKPPLPPGPAPLALIAPAIWVDCVLNTVTLPPSPLTVASAEILEPASIVVFAAVSFGVTLAPPLARARVVPRATTPPPAWPDASMRAAEPIVTVPVALTATWPPFSPADAPATEIFPSTRTSPPRPCTTTVPVRAPTLLA